MPAQQGESRVRLFNSLANSGCCIVTDGLNWSPKSPIIAQSRRNPGRPYLFRAVKRGVSPRQTPARMMQGRVMINGANRLTLSRLAAVLFMGLAFAACAVMVGSGGKSLFADGNYAAAQQTAAR